jgi:hypothetical protein
MSVPTRPLGKVLGDLRAEADTVMLDDAFLETPDYRSLLESSDWSIVVGRRGTGKSALFYRLSHYWASVRGSLVIKLAPEEEYVIALRPLMRHFGGPFTHIRAAMKLSWRYGLVMEILRELKKRYKLEAVINRSQLLQQHLRHWPGGETNFFASLRSAIKRAVDNKRPPEEQIGELAQTLQVNEIQDHLAEVLNETRIPIYILIDKLDEGYEPDTLGVAIINGVIYGATDLRSRLASVRPILFLRDNIFRAVSQEDPDYSRNVEGQVLRLHWDTYYLFAFVCNRLRRAFSLDIEQNQKVWDRCSARDVQGQDGFKKCLQLTLYRPRDVLLLLNQAFSSALRQGRQQIVLEDLESTAKHISVNRFDDLQKEYKAIFPSIGIATSRFANLYPEMRVRDASVHLEEIREISNLDTDVQQDLAILANPVQVLKNLYSVGFIGMRDITSNSWVFCHDGRNPDTEFKDEDKLLIHPCYWMALNLSRNTLDPNNAQEIYDEYEIRVSSLTPELRAQRLGSIISEVGKISLGNDGASIFEQWCLEAVRICFAGQLENVELKPNRNATQRRDIVGTNLSKSSAWARIREDYGTRQVIFEVKNFQGLGPDEFRQMLSYLTGEYGKLGFIICRDHDDDLRKGQDLEWFREVWTGHKVMIVKLSARFFMNLLSKLRSPQKHDAVDRQLNSLLDKYSRLYVSGQTPHEPRGARKRLA